jgi:hypothetical protein
LENIHKDYERQQLENTNNQLADVIITKFSELMEALDAVKDSEGMKKELEENSLLKKDIKNLVSYVTPYIPLIGILSGGITVGKHVISSKVTQSGNRRRRSERRRRYQFPNEFRHYEIIYNT